MPQDRLGPQWLGFPPWPDPGLCLACAFDLGGFVEPKLVWFEIMVCPFTFRLAVVPGYSLLFGYKEEGSDKRHTTMMRYQGNEQRIASILESLQ